MRGCPKNFTSTIFSAAHQIVCLIFGIASNRASIKNNFCWLSFPGSRKTDCVCMGGEMVEKRLRIFYWEKTPWRKEQQLHFTCNPSSNISSFQVTIFLLICTIFLRYFDCHFNKITKLSIYSEMNSILFWINFYSWLSQYFLYLFIDFVIFFLATLVTILIKWWSH